MKTVIVSAMLGPIFLTGCATLDQKLPEAPRPTLKVADVVKTVVCELQSVMTHPDARKALKTFVASTELTLGTTLSASSSPTVKLSSPTFPASATFPLGATGTNSITSKNVVDFSIKMADLDSGSAPVDPATSCDSFRQRINGTGLGLAEKVLDDVEATTGPAALTSSQYDIIFSVSVSANGGLTFNTGPFNVDIGKPTGTSVNANELKVTVAKPEPKGKTTAQTTVVTPDILSNLLTQ